MSTTTYTTAAVGETGFELFRLSKSKEIVDVCPNTLRSYFKQGLQYYQRGKAVFVSKTELAAFIRRGVAGNRFAAANPAATTAAPPDQDRPKIRRHRITERALKQLLGIQMMEGVAV